jgi:hypothetical protein
VTSRCDAEIGNPPRDKVQLGLIGGLLSAEVIVSTHRSPATQVHKLRDVLLKQRVRVRAVDAREEDDIRPRSRSQSRSAVRQTSNKANFDNRLRGRLKGSY